MAKKWLTITLAVIFILAFTGVAGAWTSETEGKPFRYASDGAAGYYVWQDQYGFHLWTLPAGGSHTFMGTIRTDGRIFIVRGHHLEAGETFGSYPEIQKRTWFEGLNLSGSERYLGAGLEVECDPNKITFKLTASEGSDGIHFQVSGASFVGFELLMDGRATPRKQIWYGGSSWHPEKHIFKFENR
jgi:hypothetical protein